MQVLGYASRMLKRWFGARRQGGQVERRVLVVCMGNICRSPMAEAVLRHKLERAGLGDRVQVDSAGTSSHHSGESPDPRAVKQATARGYRMKGLKARAVSEQDFDQFDLVLAMDQSNLASLQDRCPPELQDKLRLMLSYAPQTGLDEVPDPYYGSVAGFDRVLDLLEAACDGVLAELRPQLAQASSPAGRR